MRNDKTKLKTVKRKAKVGERILITDACITDNQYNNGDVLTVKEQSGFGGVDAEGVNVYIDHEEYEVIVDETEGISSISDIDDLVEQASELIATIQRKSFANGYAQGVFDEKMNTRRF